MHGGKSLAGIASPSAKTLKYSKYLPGRLIERYEEASNDGDLLELRSEISLTDARLADLLSRVDTGEAGEIWRSLRQTHAAGEKSLEKWNAMNGTEEGDKAKISFFEAWETVAVLIAEGADDYRAWDEVFKCIEQRRRLQETEVKRLEKLQQFVTAERVNVLMHGILNAVRTHITDRDVLAAIANDVRTLADGGVRKRAN